MLGWPALQEYGILFFQIILFENLPLLTPDLQFKKTTISVPYKGDDISHDVWTYSLFEWTRELLADPGLISQFHWHAEHHYKYDGSKFERFIDEPWTADAWWRIQVGYFGYCYCK